MSNRHPLVSLLVLALTAACSKDADVRPDNGAVAAGAGGEAGAAGTGGSAGSAGDAGNGGTKLVPTKCRQDRPGSAMALIPKPGGAFCIDKQEATRGDYAKFLDAVGDAREPSTPYCGKLTHLPLFVPPKTGAAGAAAIGCEDTGTPHAPKAPELTVNCVDWCDARDFCKWAGKRLCDVVFDPSEPQSVHTTKGEPEKAGEWSLACSNGATTIYPYGDTYAPTLCHDSKDVPPPAAKGSSYEPGGAKGCHGLSSPYDEIFDMSGGNEEWAACGEKCAAAMGGGRTTYVGDPGSFVTCWSAANMTYGHAGTGIRCCADD